MAFKIYKKHLFPYTRVVKRHNPSKRVVILEDNDEVRTLLHPEIQQLKREGIVFGEHPSNSPDLALIETFHSHERRALRDYRFSVDNARASTKEKQIEG